MFLQTFASCSCKLTLIMAQDRPVRYCPQGQDHTRAQIGAASPPSIDVRVQLRSVIMRVGVLRIAERWSRPRGGGRTGRLLAWPALLVALSVSALAEPLPRSALMLNQSDADSPWYRIFSSSFRSTLNAQPGPHVTIYAEHLDLSRFGSPRHDQL